MRRRILATLLLTLVDPTATPWWVSRPGLPSPAERAKHAMQLQATVLPVVRDLQVEYFADDGSCAALSYHRGNFVDGNRQRCQGPQKDQRPFDRIARADLQRLKAAVDASGAPIERLGGAFSDESHADEFWFTSSQGAPPGSTWSLMHGSLAENPFGLMTISAVERREHWWFVCCARARTALSPG